MWNSRAKNESRENTGWRGRGIPGNMKRISASVHGLCQHGDGFTDSMPRAATCFQDFLVLKDFLNWAGEFSTLKWIGLLFSWRDIILKCMNLTGSKVTIMIHLSE
ncbi:hypothetical protein NMG60_11018988 [Bertholletia excelsa]